MKLTRLVAAVAVLVLLGCSGDAKPLGLRVVDDRTLTLLTSCVHGEARADVDEDSDAIRISNVSGDTDDGDCLGGVTIALDEPLGDRTVIVEGNEWVPRSTDCPLGEIGPDDQADINPLCSPLP